MNKNQILAILQPFALAADDLDERTLDRSDIWEMSCAMNISAGDLRRAKEVYDALKTGGAALSC